MIVKSENCLYCGEKMESKTAKKKFCCDVHRVYYSRELKRGTLCLPKVGFISTNGSEVIKRDQHNNTLTIKPPIKEQSPYMSDAIRKKLYGTGEKLVTSNYKT